MSSAAEMALMSFFATVTLAWSGRLMICGTTKAARMPRMTTTTMISISVKPRCLFTALISLVVRQFGLKHVLGASRLDQVPPECLAQAAYQRRPREQRAVMQTLGSEPSGF